MPNTRLYKTEAIVLRQRRLGEADRILTLYTPAYGKIEAKAKGVRRTTSRMSGHLQPLTRCMVQLAQGHVRDVIAGCETLESFQALRDGLERLSRALYAMELVDRIVPEQVQSFATYRLLLDTLRRLEQAQSAESLGGSGQASSGQDPSTGSGQDLALRYFEMRLLDQSGFRPELERCVGCGSSLQPEQNYFAPQSGGVICRACVPGLAAPRLLSLEGLKVLRLLQRGTYNEVARLKAVPALAQEVERHLRSYIVCVLEREVNAAAFIERLRRDYFPKEPAQV